MDILRKMKKAVAGLLIAVSAALLLPLQTLALMPAMKVTDAYAGSVYHDRLCAVELTGDYHRDLVGVALSQVGYHEGWTKAEYDGSSTNGWKNTAEYCMTYNGMDAAWCAMFISWCARQAQIPRYVINTAARAMTDGLGGGTPYCFHMQYSNKAYYTPKQGDLVFFTSEEVFNWAHVGIVVAVDGEYITTVEGNHMNAVRMERHKLDSAKIRGYGFYASPLTVEQDVPTPNICRVEFVSTGAERGHSPEGVEHTYDFEHLYAMEGVRFDFPERAFVRDGSTLLGYHARRNDTDQWYCGEQLGWMSPQDMTAQGIRPALIADGTVWDFSWHWSGIEAVSMYAAWENEFGIMEHDALVPGELFADGDGWVCPYRDMDSSQWHYRSVKAAINGGFVDAPDEGLFRPDEAAARAMLLTALYRLAGSPKPEDTSVHFEDVPADSPWFDAVCWGYENGIIKGTGGACFEPESPLTREQLATMLHRCFGRQGDGTAETGGFSDAELVSDWAADGMAWAVAHGIVSGMPGAADGELLLAPQENTSRAQACVIAARLNEGLLSQ